MDKPHSIFPVWASCLCSQRKRKKKGDKGPSLTYQRGFWEKQEGSEYPRIKQQIRFWIWNCQSFKSALQSSLFHNYSLPSKKPLGQLVKTTNVYAIWSHIKSYLVEILAHIQNNISPLYISRLLILELFVLVND